MLLQHDPESLLPTLGGQSRERRGGRGVEQPPGRSTGAAQCPLSSFFFLPVAGSTRQGCLLQHLRGTRRWKRLRPEWHVTPQGSVDGGLAWPAAG